MYSILIIGRRILGLVRASALMPLEGTTGMLETTAGLCTRAIVAAGGPTVAARGEVSAVPNGFISHEAIPLL
jgi:hypothetical protein